MHGYLHLLELGVVDVDLTVSDTDLGSDFNVSYVTC